MPVEQDPAPTPDIVTCTLLADKIAMRLAGHLSDADLAAWAFDCFYAIELGRARCAPGDEKRITETLDMLMFADDAAFRLDEEELRRLAALLREL